MARQKQSKIAAIVGVVLLGVVGGVYLGTSIYNEQKGTPPPMPTRIELNDPYNDDWGKLSTADAAWEVTHILVSWTGANPRVTLKEPRTKDEARKLIDEIWAKYHNNPTEANWKALQKQYNEDTEAHSRYKHNDRQQSVKPFQDTAKTTRRGFARVATTEFGFHLIRRES